MARKAMRADPRVHSAADIADGTPHGEIVEKGG
jgi:hypothetical protein